MTPVTLAELRLQNGLDRAFTQSLKRFSGTVEGISTGLGISSPLFTAPNFIEIHDSRKP